MTKPNLSPSRKKGTVGPKRTVSLQCLFVLVLFLGCFSFISNLRSFPATADIDLNKLVSDCLIPQSGGGGFGGSSSHRTLAKEGLQGAAVLPFDLSVNHLEVIEYWRGALPANEVAATTEDFLPIVAAGHDVDLRFRLKAQTAPNHFDLNAIRGISAYQIVAETAHEPHTLLWDSGKIGMPTRDLAPSSIEWKDGQFGSLTPGLIVRWMVLVWDAAGNGPSSSAWSKFGVGPAADEWTGQWITHPTDFATMWHKTSNGTKVANKRKFIENKGLRATTHEACDLWKQRLPLPVARVQFDLGTSHGDVSTALLVASGLGMFSVTLNGKRVTSSAVQDPPLTDFAQRVSYRGFDVTHELQTQAQHAVGIELGSGWWDHRPINGAIVFMDFMAKGSLTAVAQLHVTYRNGTSHILVPTGQADSGWQMGKGALLESNLYTGEKVNLATLSASQGWDMFHASSPRPNDPITWVDPILYQSAMTVKLWREKLENYAVNRVTSTVDAAAPIGQLVPLEMAPVMPIRKIAPVSTSHLGSGRWVLDFGKAMSGVVRFESGVPQPMQPDKYPRAHNLSMSLDQGDKYISVVHGDSLEMSTGDIGLAIVAGFGHHAGGERGIAKPKTVDQRGGPCFPKEDLEGYQALTQRDVYVVPNGAGPSLFEKVRQPKFTVHGFRFAEVCCSEEPPTNAFAIQYRTGYKTWGSFDSSNPVLNGAYEMTRNALESNTVGVQSDCPHRERLQYGGDVISSSPAAMHMFDMSAFYRKAVRDWTDSQFSNGGYGVTSMFMDLLLFKSILKQGAGDIVWASAPPILTTRHLRHYGDLKMAMGNFQNHVEWLDFMLKHWDGGMKKAYGDLSKYVGGAQLGLGDWLALVGADSYISNMGYFLASARSVAYIAQKIIDSPLYERDEFAKAAYKALLLRASDTATEIERNITTVHRGPAFSYNGAPNKKMAQDYGVFARVMDGANRCTTLQSWLKAIGSEQNNTWPGDEEKLFHQLLRKDEFDAMERAGHISTRQGMQKPLSLYKQRSSMTGGVLGIRYTLKALSENGLHNLALDKTSGVMFPSYGSMLSFNATTLWETWWRSEDIFSRNHPMFGAVAEWLAESVAGVSLTASTTGGKEVLFWPKIPSTRKSAEIVHEASATQGTKRGDAAIAWKLLPTAAGEDTPRRKVVIRVLVPPGATAELRLPSPRKQQHGSDAAPEWTIKRSTTFPDLDGAKRRAQSKCEQRRQKGEGFPFHWHYDRANNTFYREYQKKAIGTPCESFLFEVVPPFEPYLHVNSTLKDSRTLLPAGLFEATLNDWTLYVDVLEHGYENFNMDPNSDCYDPETFRWDVHDGEHIV